MIPRSSESMLCRPVNVVCWKRAICLEFMEKVSFPDTTRCFVFVPCSSFRSILIELYALSSFFPFTFSTHNAMLVLAMQADVLEYYDQTVSSPSGSFYIPAVLRVPQLLQVVKRRRVKQSLSRKNILFRDEFTCQ